MKAIMISIRPEWVAKILNGEKIIEIRKKFPIDYVGWVYIYCTKGKTTFEKTLVRYHDGKVVARFWCDKVEEIKRIYPSWDTKIFAWETETFAEGEIENKACLSSKELRNYLAFKQIGYAVHITKLEIFDKPKEISEFERKEIIIAPYMNYKSWDYLPLTRAPQSWCYVEV